MIKFLRYSVFFLIWLCFIPKSFAQFPYVESFRAATAPGITFGGAPSAFLTAAGSSSTGGTPIDALGDGYLRLTNAARNQKGYIYSNSNFPSFYGLRAEFEYYIYGGTGADGISFFLFDATASPFNIGGFGGSLGYAQITTTTPFSPGVSKGYLAIGLDEFGNFSNPNEGRQGGVGQIPGSITLRGKGDGAALVNTNYPFLTSVKTTDFGIGLVGNSVSRVPDSTNTGYRRVFLELEPNPSGGYFVTVKLTRGGTGTLTPITIINRYPYAEAAPANLRYGFASSTGDQTNFHEVRNVSISVFNDALLVAPTANNDLKAGCPGNQVTIDASTNDVTSNTDAVIEKTSIDLDPLTAGIQNTNTIAGKGTFTANNDGTVTFVPSSSYTGNVSTNYTIKDNYGKVSTTGTITVNYIAPGVTANAGPDALLSLSGMPLSYTLAGNNPGAGNSGIWTQVSGPNVAVFNNNTMYNASVSNLVGGVYVFRWTITNVGGCQSFDDIQLLVNRPPTAVNDEVSTNVNTDVAFRILDNDTDPDGNSTIDKSAITITGNPQHGTLILDPVTGKVIYRPTTGYIGDDSFVYTVKDIYGAISNQGIVTIHINIKPIGANDLASTPTNVPVSISVLDNDLGKSGATVIPNTPPAHGSVVVNADGSIYYTPASGYSGQDTFTYIIRSSSNVDSDPITVTVNVKPVGSSDNSITSANVPVTIPVLTNDLSKTGTTVTLNTSPVNGTAGINPDGTVTYNPTVGFSGKDIFTYILRTPDGVLSDPITVNVIVKPIGSTDNVNTTPATPVTIFVKDNDLSKTGTTVASNTNPANGTVTINAAGNPVYTPNAGYSGKDFFTYVLHTADGVDSDPITVNISIRPVGTTDNATTSTNVPVTVLIKENDLSKAGTTAIINTSPSNGTVVLNSAGNPVYTPSAGFSGKDTYTYILTTADGLASDPVTVNVTVRPAGVADVVSTPPNVPVTILLKDNDPGKTGTAVTLNTNPSNGTVVLNADGSVVYTPNAGFSGKDVFTYFLNTTDGLQSDPVTVTIIVKPMGSLDNASTLPNMAVTIPVKDNDLSKAGTTVILNTNPLHGTTTLNASGIPVYTPNAGYAGKDNFTYILRTADGQDSDPITVNITVRPAGSTDNATTTTNIPITIPVKDNDVSKTGTTIILTVNPPNGILTFDATGNVVYTPNTGFSGKDVFTYILRTADGLDSDPITANVNVRPTGTTDVITITANVPTTIPVKDNDLSKTGTTVSIGTPPLHGTVTINASGVPVYVPTPGYSGPDTFTYILATPDGLQSDPISVNLTVKTPVVLSAPDLTIETPVSTPTIISGITVPPGGTVTFPKPPAHGTVTYDPVTGNVIYTPNPGYNGPDDFTYVVTDPDGNTSSPGKVTITVAIPPKIGLAKKMAKPVKNADGTYTLTYTFTIVNIGDAGIDRVSLTDDLTNTFGGNTIKINRVSATGTLRANGNYNGTSIKDLLVNTSTMDAKSKQFVTLEIVVSLDKKEGTFYNSAYTEGYALSDGSKTTDVSTDGDNPDPVTAGDFSPSEFTQVKLIKQDIFIPKGFSPNNDGINDYFTIENGAGKQISLQVYNRWGNLVHRDQTYQNTWNGKTTEGIHMGDDVPDGTYYYIINIDGKDKRVGYITIKR